MKMFLIDFTNRCFIAIFALVLIIAQLAFWGWVVTSFEHGWIALAVALMGVSWATKGLQS